ncbi:MAG: response regulator, partial [Isosphaeraceae bacterium]
MENPLVLVIDDSQTIRKMVECHLSQAGYRVALAADAELGLQMARTLQPDLILLDHQLPGTTGDEVCRKLLGDEQTSRVPVVICSAMRNRAFAQYTEFANVIDQIPKPFTPELLKSGVANALQTGAMVVQAQRTGCAMPEAVGEVHDATLEGTTQAFPLPMVLAFLNNGQQNGRLTLESGNDRIRFALSAGRVQAVYSPTIGTERLEETLPDELADLGPLLALTLGEQQDPSMAGLVKMLERSLADPRRLRGLLRFQAASLTYQGLTGPPGKFSFEPVISLPPMFQALPLQLSVAALLVDGTRHSRARFDPDEWGQLVFARQTARGGNSDRAGLSNSEIKVYTLLD